VAEASQKKQVMVTLPVLLVGGTEIQTLDLARALLAASYNVTVCCYYEYEDAVVDHFREAGAEVLLLGLDRSGQRSGILSLWILLCRLVIVFRASHPDVVHVQYLAPGLVPIVAARLAGIRTVFATVHIAGSYAYGRKAKILLRTAARLCTAFFCVSRGVEEFWFGESAVLNEEGAKAERRHYTIYNAVDVGRIRKSANAPGVEGVRRSLGLSNRPVLGIVGRLTGQKGHSVLLEALPEVINRLPEVALLVIGDGPERQALEKRATLLGVAGQIVWMGKKSRDEVFGLYGVMDIFVMPSFYEGFGLTAAEAMAAGLPVVASDIEGLREVVEHEKTGYLCPAGDSRHLAGRLLELLESPVRAREMGRLGRQRAAALFSMETYEESICLAYREKS
jgi:glycosyltransferase involved in cell wall biosynthesis